MKHTFEQLPTVIAELYEKVTTIENMLLNQNPKTESDCWYNLTELCNYLPDKPKKAKIYRLTRLNLIPHRKSSKALIFLKSEIDTWLKEGRKKTIAEISAEANTYLKIKSKRNG